MRQEVLKHFRFLFVARLEFQFLIDYSNILKSMYPISTFAQELLPKQFVHHFFLLLVQHQSHNLTLKSCLYRALQPKQNFRYHAISSMNLSIVHCRVDANRYLAHLKYTEHLPIENQFVLPNEFAAPRLQKGFLKND